MITASSGGKAKESHFIYLPQASFHSSHYNHNTSDSSLKRNTSASFPLQVTLMQKAYKHSFSGSREHAANSQRGSSIYLDFSTCAKGLWIFL